MILLYIITIVVVIGILSIIIGSFIKNKSMKITGFYMLSLTIVFVFFFTIYSLYSNTLEYNDVKEYASLKFPDRIIYKDYYDYYILDVTNNDFYKAYELIVKSNTKSNVDEEISEYKINSIKEKSRFIEFDYNTKSKNRIIVLDENNIAIINMLENGGKIVKSDIENKDKIIERFETYKKRLKKYKYIYQKCNMTNNHTSTKKLEVFSNNEGFNVKSEGIYQKVINNSSDFLNIRNTFDLNFISSYDMSNIDFSDKNVIVTVSKYNITNIEQNIGNLKYYFNSYENDYYTVSVYEISKVVNANCIYCNFSNNDVMQNDMNYNNLYSDKVISGQQTHNDGNYNTNNFNFDKAYESSNGIIQSIFNNTIQIGLDNKSISYLIMVPTNCTITNYEDSSRLNLSDLKVGDAIYVLGNKKRVMDNTGVTEIEAEKISIMRREKIKQIVSESFVTNFMIDGNGIEVVEVDKAGKGYIILELPYENFVYPAKINVNSKTENYLGYGYHLQSDYGYQKHEICWVTMDTKITDIDNIKGYAQKIEYIAD